MKPSNVGRILVFKTPLCTTTIFIGSKLNSGIELSLNAVSFASMMDSRIPSGIE